MTTRAGPFVRELPVLLFIAASSLLLRIWWMDNPVVDHDEQFYSYVATAMFEGQVPYVDVWDRKPLGLFLLYEGAHALLGRGAFAYLVMANLFACIGAWLAYRIAALLADQRTGWVAALLYLIAMTVFGCRGAQSELLFAPLCLGMIYLALVYPGSLRATLAAMLLGGLALQIKYTAAPFCAVFAAFVLVEDYRRARTLLPVLGRAALYALAGLAPTLAFAVWYAAIGHFGDFWYANFVSIFERKTSIGRFHPKTLSVIAPFLLMIAAGIWAWFRLGQTYPRRASALVVVMTGGALASIYFPSNVLAYYYAFLAPFAVLLAVPFYDLRQRAGWFGAAVLVAALVVIGNFPANIAAGRADVVQFRALTQQINAGGAGRSLYVFSGPTATYAATGTRPRAKYPFPFHSAEYMEHGAVGRPQEQIVAEFLAKRPMFILARSDRSIYATSFTAPMVLEELARHYVPVGEYLILGDGLVLYQRVPDGI
ncbi:glycosyltransferase family 39 protein [Novosphingobium sp.]|uniref:ArnT family glycosyltransferase n=1 Tax=Novosphingobium sp. TaxID=1874826 RepID=UPI002622773D|nr:glycosyltransferase family 39 protein [Novosphingobium sp.]